MEQFLRPREDFMLLSLIAPWLGIAYFLWRASPLTILSFGSDF